MRLILACIVLIGVWHAVAASQMLPAFVLPGPPAVVQVLARDHQLLATHAMTTAQEVIAGLALGLGFGAATALAMMLCAPLRWLVQPILTVSQAVPVFVLAPVLTIWFGYGPAPKIAMVVLLVFFPVASGLYDGLRATPQPVLDLARIAKASSWRELWLLRLPHALPYLGASLRVSVTYAPMGAVIGEWVGASKGLGYLMLLANARMKTDLMFAALVVIVAMTLTLVTVTDRLLRRVQM
ncbi:ABC transporter permease [Thioclava sp. SK-1]|uniref:ABC transporter permease n=1 Tax=Thioclava sp. SK-1 TaxID=1889770 RepID=UPI000824D8A0|nr:ABC transporter permease [Thioclava sp. SK-1]OCX66096.1 ABC transporter permease [Thioclava sp. SK-1]